MTKRSVRYEGFGITIEVPDAVGRAFRRFRPATPALDSKLVVSAAPPIVIDDRERPRAFMRSFAAEAATAAAREANGGGADSPDETDEIAAQGWYHTIELPDGVVTPGRFDHRRLLPYYGLPTDLRGKRVLDVGSGDGFWAFALERRGGEVTSLDIETFAEVDLPPELHRLFVEHPVDLSFRRGFEIAHRRLGSHVKLANGPIYDLDPETIGTFDFVHAGDILLHLRDPALALQRLHAVTKGEILIADCFDPALDELGAGPGLTRYRGGWEDATWWGPALSTLTQMVADAGFQSVRVLTTYNLSDLDSVVGPWRAVIRARA